MRISDWSSDVCSSDLFPCLNHCFRLRSLYEGRIFQPLGKRVSFLCRRIHGLRQTRLFGGEINDSRKWKHIGCFINNDLRSEEHTSELQSLMRISYAVFCLKKKNKKTIQHKLPTYDDLIVL